MTTDTPRTDAAAIRCACSTYVVPSEFARELERENAALRKRLEILSKSNEKQTEEYICVDREHGLWKRAARKEQP